MSWLVSSGLPLEIVLVHNDEKFATRAASTLRSAGYEATVFADPMQALDALEAAETHF